MPLKFYEYETKVLRTKCGRAWIRLVNVSGEVCQFVVTYDAVGRICIFNNRIECHRARRMSAVINCMVSDGGSCVIPDKVVEVIKQCMPLSGIHCRGNRVYLFTTMPVSDISMFNFKKIAKEAVIREIVMDP